MTRIASFTSAQIARAIRGARAVDPLAVVELVTAKGIIRILPQESVPAADDLYAAWKAKREDKLARRS
jgi:hypothetical protein